MKKNFLILCLSPLALLALTGCHLIIFPSVDTSYSSEKDSLIPSESESSESTPTSNPESSEDTTSINESSEPVTSEETPSESEESSLDESSEEDSSTSEEEVFKPALENSEEYLEFWNPSTYISLSINMSQSAANYINNYQSNHGDSTYHDYYVPCTVNLTVNDAHYTFEEVGIRQKGNLSRRTMLIDNHFSLDSLVHFKLNFQETFDDEEYDDIPALQEFKKTWSDSSLRKERKNRTLFDMEKIDLKWNRNDDATKVKQSFAYKVFRDNGVIAGHTTLADTTLSINGSNSVNTTYEILECIDKVLIKRFFDKAHAGGDLYKCTYSYKPADMCNYSNEDIGVEDNVSGYHPPYDLKTNKKSSDHSAIQHFFSVINDSACSASAYKANLEEVMNVEDFIMYESIAYLMGNFDDLRNNANNYYLYFDGTKQNIAYVIPYDFDRCLGCGCEGIQDYMTNFSPESTKMQCDHRWQTNILYWRTICSTDESSSGYNNIERIEEYRALYQSNIENILNSGMMSESAFTSYVNSFPNSYRGNPNGAGNNNTTYGDYLNRKVNIIKEYYNGVTI